MKFSLRAKREEGVALVITLVMLAVVTVMAVVFLAVTRRERSSVKLAEETAIAKDMADAALERVKTEAISGMNVAGSKLHYDLFNSQSFFNPAGFDASRPPTNSNVARVRDWPTIRQQGEKNYLELLGNLQFDPAVPVFVETNQSRQGDFRFYLDFNRNRQFETNGVLPELDVNEQPITRQVNSQTLTNFARFVGDPEWIGVLERPDFPHSETNRFVGRFAYLVLPAGKSLDLNFMHNQVNGPAQLDSGAPQQVGFSRSQGVGSWEINLAGFLRQLNTNNYSWWRPGTAAYEYRVTNPNQAPTARGLTFDDARQLVSFRYRQPVVLRSIFEELGTNNILYPVQTVPEFEEFRRVDRNNIEDFGDRPYLAASGEIFFPPADAPQDQDDVVRKGWPGSFVTNAYTDLQQLFDQTTTGAGFQQRLQNPARRGATAQTGKSSYDRYTFYRMASQLGTDSSPALEGKIHLNFQNPIGQITNSVVPWTNAVEFFTNAADLMLKASIDEVVTIATTNVTAMRAWGRPPGTYYRISDTLVRTNFSITNIQVEVYNPIPGIIPFQTQNEYTPTIHRILQVAANIYDNMNDNGQGHPHVFVPLFAKRSMPFSYDGVTTTNVTSIAIVGFTEAVDAQLLTRPWADLTAALTNTSVQFGFLTNVNFYGQHMVIGAKKGHPNFNELAFQANVDISRKLSATRESLGSTNILSTNQMFIVNMNNRWGMEAWNSYRTPYTSLRLIHGEVISHVVMRDGSNIFNNPPVYEGFVTNVISLTPTDLAMVGNWVGATQYIATNFVVPFDRFTNLINERSYTATNRIGTDRFGPTNSLAQFGPLERSPQFFLFTTNKVRFWMINQAGRIVDFVSFDKLSTLMDLGKHLYPNPTRPSGSSLFGGGSISEDMFWDPTPLDNRGFTVGHSNQLAMSLGDAPFEGAASDALWRAYKYNPLTVNDKNGAIGLWRHFIGARPRGEYPRPRNSPEVLIHQAPFTPTKSISWTMSWQVNDPLVHYMHQDLRRLEEEQRLSVNVQMTNWNIGRLNKAYHPWDGSPLNVANPSQAQADEFVYNVGLQDPGIRRSDDWEFPYMRRDTRNGANTNYFFPNIGTLGQVHRGTPWQTLYLKSIYRRNPANPAVPEVFVNPSVWLRWAGSVGTYPARDWRLLDVFTTAPNENAARGLLGVNQTNGAAWSAILGGVVVAKSDISSSDLQGVSSVSADRAFTFATIEPGSPEMNLIIQSIHDAHTNQFNIVSNPNLAADPKRPLLAVLRTNQFGLYSTFDRMGDILNVPALSVQSPYLLRDTNQIVKAWNDQAVEYIPQQILSLLRKDEPRFVVYAFGQALKPAPRSLTSDPDYYHMCTNYQIMSEVVTKTVFRVEGEPFGHPQSTNSPLRAVVEKYEILPPPE